MKIAWFKEIISPEIGAYLAGYSLEDKSVAKRDDLYMTGLCADDGENKVLIVSFDLLGLDEWYSVPLREKCGKILGIDKSAVLFSCTHTHSGPETRTLARCPEQLYTEYLKRLDEQIQEAVRNLKDFRECTTYFYSSECDENTNRRYISACNTASYLPFRRELTPVATGFADKELGQLIFIDNETRMPIYMIGNYAAHPLAGHGPGIGGRTISADYPGVFRNYVTAESGAECMFISGAAGDLVPNDAETGIDAIRKTGTNLAKAALGGIIDATRNPGRFCMADAKVGSVSKKVTIPIRKHKVGTLNKFYSGDTAECEIQVISIGDVCFVGVPGELCSEVGQEIKWHSPFRRAYIAYNSTAYLSYMGHTSMLLSGGYEGNAQFFSRNCGLLLLNTAANAMFELHDTIFPQENDEIYPDNVQNQLVNIPPNR